MLADTETMFSEWIVLVLQLLQGLWLLAIFILYVTTASQAELYYLNVVGLVAVALRLLLAVAVGEEKPV